MEMPLNISHNMYKNYGDSVCDIWDIWVHVDIILTDMDPLKPNSKMRIPILDSEKLYLKSIRPVF